MAGQEKGLEMAAKNEQKFRECLDIIEQEVGIDKDELERRIKKIIGRETAVNTEELGVKLARLIIEMINDSTEEISRILGADYGRVLFEYITLLLWIATKDASTILPKESIQSTIDIMMTVVIGDCEEPSLGECLVSNFGVYYQAWEGYGPRIMAEMEAKGGKEAVQQFREAIVAHNFVIMCLTDEVDGHETQAEYEERYPTDKYYADHVGCVLKHYRRFSEKVMRVLSTSC